VNIVVASLKGGVGKSTTAVYLAAAAAERGDEPVVLVDADRAEHVAEAVRARFDRSGFAAPRTFDVVPAAGARRIR